MRALSPAIRDLRAKATTKLSAELVSRGRYHRHCGFHSRSHRMEEQGYVIRPRQANGMLSGEQETVCCKRPPVDVFYRALTVPILACRCVCARKASRRSRLTIIDDPYARSGACAQSR